MTRQHCCTCSRACPSPPDHADSWMRGARAACWCCGQGSQEQYREGELEEPREAFPGAGPQRRENVLPRQGWGKCETCRVAKVQGTLDPRPAWHPSWDSVMAETCAKCLPVEY